MQLLVDITSERAKGDMVDRVERIQPPVERSNPDAGGSRSEPPTDDRERESRIPTDPGVAAIRELGDAVIGMYFIG